MKANEINITIKCDDDHIAKKFKIPTDCIPSIGDHVIIDGITFECLAREIEMQNGIANVTVELKTKSS